MGLIPAMHSNDPLPPSQIKLITHDMMIKSSIDNNVQNMFHWNCIFNFHKTVKLQCMWQVYPIGSNHHHNLVNNMSTIQLLLVSLIIKKLINFVCVVSIADLKMHLIHHSWQTASNLHLSQTHFKSYRNVIVFGRI